MAKFHRHHSTPLRRRVLRVFGARVEYGSRPSRRKRHAVRDLDVMVRFDVTQIALRMRPECTPNSSFRRQLNLANRAQPKDSNFDDDEVAPP